MAKYELVINQWDVFNSLKKAFRAWAKVHKNFMTPYIVKLYEIKERDIIIELSTGEGFNDETIYGISVRRFEDNTFANLKDKDGKSYNIGQMFHELDKAEKYAKELKGFLKNGLYA